MRRGDGGDQGDMRTGEADQRADFAEMVHADFDHAIFGVARHGGQRQRHAPLIVVGRRRGMGAAERTEGQPQHLLGRGLSGAAGDGHDPAHGVRARAARARSSRPRWVWPTVSKAGALRQMAGIACYQRGCGLGLEGGRDEVVTVAVLALQRDEKIARLQACACRSRCRTPRRARVARPSVAASASCGGPKALMPRPPRPGRRAPMPP